MKESDTGPLTLPAQMKTKTIPCSPKRRLKHYIGQVIKILVIRFSSIIYVSDSASIDRWPWIIYTRFQKKRAIFNVEYFEN